MFVYFIGVDLGQAQDYTAISILQRREVVEPQNVRLSEYTNDMGVEQCLVDVFDLRHLERFALGTSYVEIVDRISRLMFAPELQAEKVLVVDQTGTGRPVTDMLRAKALGPLVAITITGGMTVTQTADGFNVPKRDLVSILQTHLQSGRLGIADALPDADLLRDEMLNFRTKVRLEDGEEQYGVWREGVHDDLVLATAISLWYGSRFSMDGRRPLYDLGIPPNTEPYDPLRYGL